MALDERELRRQAALEDACKSISAGRSMSWQDEIRQLRAEVERLRVENAFFRDRLKIISAKADGEHVWRFYSHWTPFVGPNVDEVMRRVIESLPAPPAKEE